MAAATRREVEHLSTARFHHDREWTSPNGIVPQVRRKRPGAARGGNGPLSIVGIQIDPSPGHIGGIDGQHATGDPRLANRFRIAGFGREVLRGLV
jgi:hypothetical protein